MVAVSDEAITTTPRLVRDPIDGPLIDTSSLIEVALEPQPVRSENRAQVRVADASRVLAAFVRSTARRVDRYPHGASARAAYATALLRHGDLDAAIRELEVAVEQSPDPYPHIMLARAYIAAGRHADAVAVSDRLLADTPGNRGVTVTAALARLVSDDVGSAIRLLRSATEYRDKTAQPAFYLGIAYLALTPPRVSEAIKYLKQAVRANVRHPESHRALARAYLMNGNRVRAIRELRAALHQAPMDLYSLTLLYKALVEADVEDAQHEIRERLRRIPESYSSLELRAWLDMDVGATAPARSALYSALSIAQETGAPTTDIARIANNLAVTYRRLGDTQLATQFARRSTELHPTTEGYFNLASLMIESSRLGSAVETLQESRFHFPDDEDLRLLETHANVLGNRNDLAVVLLERWIVHRSASARAFTVLGAILWEEMRNAERALAVLRQGMKRFPEDHGVINNLAYTLLSIESIPEATEALSSISLDDMGRAPTIELTATFGLKSLRSGDTRAGLELYDRAVDMARESGRNDVADAVTQKKCLEYARVLVEAGNYRHAVEECRLGLQVTGRRSFRRDLESMLRSAEASLSH